MVQDGPSEPAVPVPKSKKQRTLHAIGAAAADEAPVINIRSAKAPPAHGPAHPAGGHRLARARARAARPPAHDRRGRPGLRPAHRCVTAKPSGFA